MTGAITTSRSPTKPKRLTILALQIQRAHRRESFLVAKVPVAALFTLLLTNLLFVLTGLLLLIITLSVRSADGVDDVQARLSITGLVADRFEDKSYGQAVDGIEELYDEHEAGGNTRVAVVGTDRDGYVYRKI